MKTILFLVTDSVNHRLRDSVWNFVWNTVEDTGQGPKWPCEELVLLDFVYRPVANKTKHSLNS